MTNPWMSAWLSAANAWAGPMRGFWTAEMHRQQTAMMNEMIQQSVKFWSGAWLQAAQQAARPNLTLVEPSRKRASR